MTINVVYRVQCSGPCRRWLSIPDGYEPGEDLPLAALEPRPTAARAGMWPDETAARYAAFAAGWSSGTCPDCHRGDEEQRARRAIQCADAFWLKRPHTPHDWRQRPDAAPVHCPGSADGEQQPETCGACEPEPRTGTSPCVLPAGHGGTKHQDKWTNQWAAGVQPYTPPAHYRRDDGVDCCVHAIPVGPDSCRHCRELADDEPAVVPQPGKEA